MNKLVIRKGTFREEIIIGKTKYILGTNSDKKLQLMRCFDEFIRKTAASEFSTNNQNQLRITMDEKELSSKNTDIIRIDTFYYLNQELKMQSRSLILQSVESILSRVDYAETLDTIDTLVQSICMQFNEENELKLVPQRLTVAGLAKLVQPLYFLDDEICNEYDLNAEEIICLQLRILYPLLQNSNRLTIVLVDMPSVTERIINEIEAFSTAFFIINCDRIYPHVDIRNCYLMNSYSIDLADDEQIYEHICLSILHESDIEKGRDYMQRMINRQIYSIKQNK